MKKFVTAAFLALFVLSFGYSLTTGDSVVIASVPSKLEVTDLLAELDLGSIDSGAADSGDITFKIRSNQKSWKVSAKSTYGSKLVYGGTVTEWTLASKDETIYIPYTVKLVDGASAEYTAVTTLTTADQVLNTFNRKTTGGATPENFKLSVSVAANSADHVYGFYQDTITITIAAN